MSPHPTNLSIPNRFPRSSISPSSTQPLLFQPISLSFLLLPPIQPSFSNKFPNISNSSILPPFPVPPRSQYLYFLNYHILLSHFLLSSLSFCCVLIKPSYQTLLWVSSVSLYHNCTFKSSMAVCLFILWSCVFVRIRCIIYSYRNIPSKKCHPSILFPIYHEQIPLPHPTGFILYDGFKRIKDTPSHFSADRILIRS